MNNLEQIVTEECEMLQNVVFLSVKKLENRSKMEAKKFDIDLSERIEKIKSSVERINKLMKELKGTL